MKKPKVVVVMPAYNAARTVERTYHDIPPGVADEVLLVDDASKDETVRVARQLGIQVFIHPRNRGYGGNQKTCYTEALKLGADVVVMLHPDYQYDPKRMAALVQPILDGRADLVLGSRLLEGRRAALGGGMPLYKYWSNRFLTAMENLVLGQRLSEMHTGYRAYTRRLLTTIPFMRNSEGFVFDTEVIVQTVAFGFQIAEISVPSKYADDSSCISFKNSAIYGFRTLMTLLKFAAFKAGMSHALFKRARAARQ